MNAPRMILLCLAVAVLVTPSTRATSYRFLKFGTPIVAEDRLVFSEAAWDPHRIICIDRVSGKKLWEVTDRQKIHPTFIFEKELVLTVGSNVYGGDLGTGKLKELYRTGFEECSLLKQPGSRMLVKGERADVDYLSYVDCSTWRKLWETPKLVRLCAEGTDVLLCEQAARKPAEGSGYRYIDAGLAAVSKKDGKVLWRRAHPKNVLFANAVAISKFFVVNARGKLYCLRQGDGHVVTEVKLSDSDYYVGVSLVGRRDSVLMWTAKGHDVFSGHLIFELKVPTLEKSELTETDWYAATSFTYGDVVIGQTIGRIDAWHIPTRKKLWQGGQWNWEGVHNGFIYFSDRENDGVHTTINRIEVKTGKRERLYEETFPIEMQRKKP